MIIELGRVSEETKGIPQQFSTELDQGTLVPNKRN